MQVVFLHGLESGPCGAKYQALLAAGLGPLLAPDCTGLTTPAERLAVIREALGDLRELLLVGSSFGGLMALQFAAEAPDQVAAMVLCAPAIHRSEPGWRPPLTLPDVPVRALHGERDALIALDAVQAWCSRHAVPLLAVDDDHRLSNHHEALIELVREVMQVCEREQ